MIKTLIVDDDFLVRMFLKQITDWESAGFTLIEDACNGKEAISIIERELPELIITDLSMPVMDGIALINQVKEKYADICIVALSCHDEFEYVKEAMKLGADEYVLKNLLNEESLLSILASIRVKISQTTAIRQEENELQRLAKKGREQFLQELLEVLSQNPHSIDEQQKLFYSSGVPYSFRRCAALITTAEDTAVGILQPICEQYCRNKNAVCLGKLNDSCIILLDLSDLHSQAEQWERMVAFTDGLKNCIVNYLNARAAIGISGLNSGDGGIYSSISQAQTALEYLFYGYRIYRYSELSKVNDMPEEMEILKRIQVNRAEYNDEKIHQLSRQAFDSLQKALINPNRIKDWFSVLMQNRIKDGNRPDTLDEMEKFWLAAMTYNLTNKEAEQEISNNRAISQAVTYIQKHFREPISLSKVAAEVHLNASYLSFLFKQEMGVNFSDYLTNCRLECIKELLNTSNRSIKESAAAAGFQDYRNFCKLFKKETGLRPADYRNLKK